MVEPKDRAEVSGDDAAGFPLPPLPDNESEPLSHSLVQQTIDQLRRLRDDYRQARAWLEQMDRRFAQREAQISQRLHKAVSRVTRSRPFGNDADPISRPTSPEYVSGHLTLYVRTLGKFEVFCSSQTTPLGSSKKGRAVFRYLVTCPEQRAAKDVILDLFWPDEEAERASHKLHIAISVLRQALNDTVGTKLQGGEPILFEDNHYSLNPAIEVHLDADGFAAHCQAGERLERENRLREATAEYEAALALYRGDFLTEDLYADWTAATRARLEETYLTLLSCLASHYLAQSRFTDCISCCRQILAKDSFREDAYRQLMRCYSRMGRRNQALQEYHACKEVLQRELGVQPMRETTELYEQIVCEEVV